ncbi:MAG TPA: pantoate--beta-alanine ligase [Acidimicrobiales bacterium]|nr:pantoate--beta-alanine ligase [Acidimicrobiales bacterium]
MPPTTIPVLTTAAELRPVLDRHRSSGGTVGLIGTSGGLHQGHLSLIRASVDSSNLTVLWLFTGRVPINTGAVPSYDRNYRRDQELAIEAGASIIFRPPNEELFALGKPLVRLQVADALRIPWPGSGDGVFVDMVANIMAKAVNVVGPCRLYCGEKDWQNVAVLRRMVTDLSMAVDIVACPSVREADGLVVGSRNTKLEPEERQLAVGIRPALEAAKKNILGGEDDPGRVVARLRAQLESIGRLEYAVVVEAATLTPANPIRGDLRVLVSIAFAHTNLMDNVGVSAPAPS